MTPLRCWTGWWLLIKARTGFSDFIFFFFAVYILKFSVPNGNVRLYKSAAIFYPRYIIKSSLTERSWVWMRYWCVTATPFNTPQHGRMKLRQAAYTVKGKMKPEIRWFNLQLKSLAAQVSMQTSSTILLLLLNNQLVYWQIFFATTLIVNEMLKLPNIPKTFAVSSYLKARLLVISHSCSLNYLKLSQD